MPAVSSYSGTINLTAASSGAGAQTTIAAQAYSPAGLPVIQMRRRATSQSNEPLLWISFTATTALTLSGYPGFAITLPASANTNGTFSLAFYDPTHASLGWQLIGGPVSAVGQTVTFAPGSTPVSFAANQTYVFALYESPNAPTPSPTPSATAGSTPTPLPGAVAQLTETSYKVDPGDQPAEIVAGSDGNLWFTECPTYFNDQTTTNGAVVKITPSGVTTAYTLTGLPVRCPYAIVPAPDGNLWFTEERADAGTPPMGEITTSGTISEYPLAYEATGGLVVGSDSNLWFASDANVYAFNRISQSIVGSATLPSGYTGASTLGSNPATGEVLLVGYAGSQVSSAAIFSFQPAALATVTLRYQGTANTGYTALPGQFAVGADGNIYGWAFINNSTNVQQLLALNANTYAASYLTLPSTFIFGTAAIGAEYSPPMVFLDGNLFIENGGPKSPVRGIAEFSISGVMLGQANSDESNFHAGWAWGVAGPDGNVWYAVNDGTATEGWIERIEPVSASGSAMRTRR